MSGRALLYTKRHPHNTSHIGHRQPIIYVPDPVRIKRVERD